MGWGGSEKGRRGSKKGRRIRNPPWQASKGGRGTFKAGWTGVDPGRRRFEGERGDAGMPGCRDGEEAPRAGRREARPRRKPAVDDRTFFPQT